MFPYDPAELFQPLRRFPLSKMNDSPIDVKRFGDRFANAVALFDDVNAQDPNREDDQPRELLYAQRMSAMLARYAPDANEAVALAVRAQHIERWRVPRSSYPMTKEGYYRWRTGLYVFHADRAAELMQQAGYAEDMQARVKAAVGKVGLRSNPETQRVEDVASLVFIEHYMKDFAAGKPDYDEARWLGIIRKTWNKMSERAHAFALSGALKLPAALVPLIQKAIA
jgi:hypothetical protein